MNGCLLLKGKIKLLPLLVVVFFMGTVSSASAQFLHLDPMPWTSPPDSTSRLALEVQLDRFQDARFNWSGNRILLSVILPAGDNTTYFVRMPHVNFDFGSISLYNRWPWVRGDEAEMSWPSETRTSSFGQPEAGAVGNLTWPFMGPFQYGVALGLPVGSDRVYPISSTSLPLRSELRKRVPLNAQNELSFVAGFLMNMGSGKGLLGDSAFPSGHHAGARLDKRWSNRRKFSLCYDYENRDGRKSQLLGAQIWFPWTSKGRVGFSAARQLQGTLNRFADWQFTVTWRFDSAKYQPGSEEEGEAEPGSKDPPGPGRK